MQRFFPSSLSYLLNHEILIGARLPIGGRSHILSFKLGLDLLLKNGKGDRKKYVKIRWL